MTTRLIDILHARRQGRVDDLGHIVDEMAKLSANEESIRSNRVALEKLNDSADHFKLAYEYYRVSEVNIAELCKLLQIKPKQLITDKFDDFS